ncbi:hypothetical protein L873DRAFT_616940 [Choiromyces venosus 120613-1]|uniref:Retrotransposon gag domain-containing protein n=1 Tax=Choiromyces venosus 120613-1 TaxID=1336337 RepID=A0A3N4IV21_9PEZI|nr:hypothetical protein L873DRAFT_616940 [Choiromyces venosus 120613-1]
MVSPRSMGIVFTGDGGIGVQAFLRWMESWFATMGEDFNGGTVKSKKMRVAQIHVACPIRSVAGSFLRTLSDEVLWDEDILKERVIEQFDDAEMDGQAREDILSTMSTIRQGDHDVFRYSQKVLKLLRRKPDGLHHYDKILIRYYIDGLESQRLREMAILSFLRADSHENPHQVVKGVMRLATQLRIKGYKRHGSDDDDDDDMSPREESIEVDESDDNSESDAEVYYSRSRRSKQAKREKKSGKKGARRSRGKGARKHKEDKEEDSVRGEVRNCA